MRVTITKFRQDLFRLMDRAIEGEPIQFSHKGVVFDIVPETTPDKLARLVRQEIVATKSELDQAGRELLEEMESEWQKDWAEL